MRWRLYRIVMRIAHYFNWHYAPPIYPDGDTVLWCKWCGMRDIIKKGKLVNSPAGIDSCNNGAAMKDMKEFFR